MTNQTDLGGTFRFLNSPTPLNRMGYGAMQLAGPHVWGPPRDPEAAVAVLREVVARRRESHRHQRLLWSARDQSDHQTGASSISGRPDDSDKKSAPAAVTTRPWIPALSRQELTDGVHGNLRNLGLETLDVVNLRVGGVMGPSEGSIEEPLTMLAELKAQGLIQTLGLK